MNDHRSAHRGAAIDPARIRAVVDLSRVWLGVGEDRTVRPLKVLAPQAVLQVLQADERVAWQGWSIKATSARRIGLAPGEAEWPVGIIAVSGHGFVSGLRVALESVQRVCAEITKIETRRTACRLADVQEAGLLEWGLDDH